MKRILKNLLSKIIHRCRKHQYKNITLTSTVRPNVKVYNSDNLVMGRNTNIDNGALIMNTRARFVMKDNSGAAIGLTVVTGNHLSIKGKLFKMVTNKDKDIIDVNHELDKDVIVEEDVWIGSNVTLLSGTHINRGAIVGSGSIVRTSIPPYSIVIGNPAKVIGFRFTPEEIIEHEKLLYPENQRLALTKLERNYKKYYTDRLKEISKYIKI